MICPACKSNNIDTAKFCGGCGSSLKAGAASAEPPSSLVSCAQGHVYSAVYNACPYCPSAERLSTSDFATRIEPLAETNIEALQTNVEPLPTVAEPIITRPVPATVVEPPADQNRTGPVRRDYATVIDPDRPDDASTGQMPSAPATQVVPVTPPPAKPPAPATVVEPVAPPPPTPAPAQLKGPPAVSSVPESRPVASVPALPPSSAGSVQRERRTVVVPHEDAGSQGRLVGWLVSFSQQVEGKDYRLRAGRNVIGANPSCDIVINDDAVSGVHASIVFRNGHCYLKDELSSNGTFLNSVEVMEPEQLQSYDQLRVGNVLLTFISLDLNP